MQSEIVQLRAQNQQLTEQNNLLNTQIIDLKRQI